MDAVLDPLEIAAKAMRQSADTGAAISSSSAANTPATSVQPPPLTAAPPPAATVPAPGPAPTPTVTPATIPDKSGATSTSNNALSSETESAKTDVKGMAKEKVLKVLRHPLFYFGLTFVLAFVLLLIVKPGFVQTLPSADKQVVPGEDRPCSYKRVIIWSLVAAVLGALIPLVAQNWGKIKDLVSKVSKVTGK